MELVRGGLDPSIAETPIEATGSWPHDSHRRLIASLADLCNQKEMEVKAAQVVTKTEMLPV